MRSKQLRILLVSPRDDFFYGAGAFREYIEKSRDIQTILKYWRGMGSGLQTVASVTPPDHQVEIVNENRGEIDFDAPYDLVGVTAMTQQVTRAYEIAAEFRRRGRHVAIGGIHATVMPDEVAHHADTVVAGEAEEVWPGFIRDLREGTARPLYSGEELGPVNLAATPTPRHDLVAKYRVPVVWVQTTRGCPHDCEFCAATRVYGRRYRCKSVEQVIAEVRHVRSIWKTATITFADDNMFVNLKRSRALLEAFSRERFSWSAICDISIGRDDAFLRDLRASGCRFVFVGLESASRDSLRGVDPASWKERMHGHYSEYVRRIQENGIGVYGGFIVGLDGDDSTVVDRTVRFVNDNCLMAAQVTILTPVPGSRLRQRMQEEKRIVTDDWRWYTGWNEVIRHPAFAPGDLERCLMEIYQGIYNDDSSRKRSAYFRQVWENLNTPRGETALPG
jgi:radical SAM superfamily enzyme YgiQ (UPF0313 family)